MAGVFTSHRKFNQAFRLVGTPAGALDEGQKDHVFRRPFEIYYFVFLLWSSVLGFLVFFHVAMAGVFTSHLIEHPHQPFSIQSYISIGYSGWWGHQPGRDT